MCPQRGIFPKATAHAAAVARPAPVEPLRQLPSPTPSLPRLWRRTSNTISTGALNSWCPSSGADPISSLSFGCIALGRRPSSMHSSLCPRPGVEEMVKAPIAGPYFASTGLGQDRGWLVLGRIRPDISARAQTRRVASLAVVASTWPRRHQVDPAPVRLDRTRQERNAGSRCDTARPSVGLALAPDFGESSSDSEFWGSGGQVH